MRHRIRFNSGQESSYLQQKLLKEKKVTSQKRTFQKVHKTKKKNKKELFKKFTKQKEKKKKKPVRKHRRKKTHAVLAQFGRALVF